MIEKVPEPDARGAVDAYLRRHARKDLLRFVTCGSVDDGKSTLLGRLLHDAKAVLDDQLAALEADNRRHGTQSGALDFALLVDGLDAEREQGITIDVAYRFFDTERRKFIAADCPGHEQYTRNMATGASTADLAIVLVDARKGVLTQTRRHSYIASLLGIRDVVLAVNKMDMVSYREDVFDRIVGDYRLLSRGLGVTNVYPIPVSALKGDNMLEPSGNMPWYRGPALLPLLETVVVAPFGVSDSFRMPVQWICRPDQDFRGAAGMVVSGHVRQGMPVVIQPSGISTTVSRIVLPDGEAATARCGQPVMLALDDDVDVSRGDVIACASDPAAVSDQFAAHLLWMDDRDLYPGRSYRMKIGAKTVNAQVTEIKHKVDVNTQEHLAAKFLKLNEVAYCNLFLDENVAFQPYRESRALGAFILIDRHTNATVAAGTINFALRRAANVQWHHLEVDKRARATAKGQQPRCVWFTGISGAGKSTIANLVEKRLVAMGYHTYLLDGDNVRHGLNKDLGFTDEDRVENIRRVAEVAKLMVDAGLVVLVSFISPFQAERRMARTLFADEEFLEVFVDTPLEVAEMRDPKGLYAKARAGTIPNFTGIDSPYERPVDPDLVLEAGDPALLGELVERVVQRVVGSGTSKTAE